MSEQSPKNIDANQNLSKEFDPKAYSKQNSFLEIRYQGHTGDIFQRIQKVLDNLPALDLAKYQKKTIKSACNELLKKSAPEGDFLPFALHPYNIAEIDQLAENELPRYLFYRYRYETFPQRHQLDDYPPCLQIEPTSICNYRCVFCYQTDSNFTDKKNGWMGNMSFDLFKSIIDQAQGRCEAITLASRGEPLICPDIENMLDYTRGKFVALKLNTNAWFLDEKKCHAILKAELNSLVFSVDAASEPTYSHFRVGGELDRIHKNIKLFHHIRFKHYPNSRIITRISGVKFPGVDQLDEMENFWGDLVDQVAFVNYNPWENIYQAPLNHIKEPCSELWRRLFIWWDGTTNPCDSDFKSILSTENMSNKNLSEIWLSEKYKELREKHLSQVRPECSPCNRCSVV